MMVTGLAFLVFSGPWTCPASVCGDLDAIDPPLGIAATIEIDGVLGLDRAALGALPIRRITAALRDAHGVMAP